MSYPSKEEAVKRYVASCKQFDKENATSSMNLWSAVRLWEKGQQEGSWGESERNDEILAKYAKIPESIIRSIKGILDHNRKLQDILFSGEGSEECDLEEYLGEKKKFWEGITKHLE
jgi:hypothetical protein